jgi:hypothetical protein
MNELHHRLNLTRAALDTAAYNARLAIATANATGRIPLAQELRAVLDGIVAQQAAIPRIDPETKHELPRFDHAAWPKRRHICE